ncbi:RipA family octameric membrane protein [Actinoplanes couchii]|uniref:RipA family octameric membrane protein n=1 Tax=Actinoplanes couchii TaxID=403638 RepID=UPI00194056A8|nr:hypothetical protein [Actinoplanes couchii]MDR6321987.1 hypothetical protein [Actinoplanes couchii]
MTMARRLTAAIGRRQAPIDSIREGLWTSTSASAYEGPGEKYQAAIMEQYKIYVEMADRVTARRSLHNTFFLTANTAAITLSITFFQSLSKNGNLLLFPLSVVLFQCVAWFWILRSYRQLSSAKFRVIGVLEEKLPASPYWLAEWKAIGSGKSSRLYLPITQIEQWTPLIFGLAYIAVFFVNVAQ